MEYWYNTVKEQFIIYNYNLLNIQNIDESGFDINKEQAMKVLIYLNNI